MLSKYNECTRCYQNIPAVHDVIKIYRVSHETLERRLEFRYFVRNCDIYSSNPYKKQNFQNINPWNCLFCTFKITVYKECG